MYTEGQDLCQMSSEWIDSTDLRKRSKEGHVEKRLARWNAFNTLSRSCGKTRKRPSEVACQNES